MDSMENDVIYAVRFEIYSSTEETQVDVELYRKFNDALDRLKSLAEEWKKMDIFLIEPWISNRINATNHPSFYIDDTQGNSRSAEIILMPIR